jgi:ribosomal protein S18 acetylase RimI-like enzyme
MDINMKRLSECTFNEALLAWNDGFQGYFTDATMTLATYTARLGGEGLSPDHSVVAFADGKPVGCVINGIREIDGKKVAWNGGTAVAPDYRRQGVGKALIEATLAVYREEGVDVATLEAIAENEKAIALYEQMGYITVDLLVFLQHNGKLESSTFIKEENKRFGVKRGIPQDVRALSFYKGMSPWQTQWASVRDGESMILMDGDTEVGYVLYKRVFDKLGKPASIVLYQIEAEPNHLDEEDILRFGLSKVFAPLDAEVKRTTMNLPESHLKAVQILKEYGFTPAIGQVYMIKDMKGL